MAMMIWNAFGYLLVAISFMLPVYIILDTVGTQGIGVTSMIRVFKTLSGFDKRLIMVMFLYFSVPLYVFTFMIMVNG